jgi:mannose-6-phosphate isomerase-like protein (cupin superfamily)
VPLILKDDEMRLMLLLFGCWLGSVAPLHAQLVPAHALQAEGDFLNVYNRSLFSDSLVSSFYIEVKREVPAHFHRKHSEHVLVLSGRGVMHLGDSVFVIGPGDFIFIPKGSIHSVRTSSAEPLRVISIQAPYFDGSDRVVVE